MNFLMFYQRNVFLIFPNKRNQKNAICFLYVRLQTVMAYNSESCHITPIIMFKPLLSFVLNIKYDYGLQNVIKVDVHVVDGNHVMILEDMKIVMAVNDKLFEVATTLKI
ncbi:LOW QUALITY PROTEIN: fatty acid synthase-like [Vespula squamosa]|uniref:Fatty acid synthase-like n=1 Tax=Vespula squamosa TaxID=30214 RepID=A0ABD2A6A6_VESSQ